MCYAIVEVRYRTPSQPEIMRIADAETLGERLHQLQNSEQVVSITVFTLSKTLTRTTTWSES